MNKKITVKNQEGKIRYCILSGEEDLEKQFNDWYFGQGHTGMGYTVHFNGTEVRVLDYYVNETRAVFEVLSIEDTDAEPVLAWMDPNKSKSGWA